MAKYGNGISMRDVQILEWEEIRQILESYRVSAEDTKRIEDNYKDKCYQWCKSNASACYFEENMRQLMGEKLYLEFVKLYIKNFSPYETEKMNATYAWYKEE